MGAWEQTTRSHAYTNRFKLGQHLEVGQKFLCENHRQDHCKSQKLQYSRLGLFTVLKRVTIATHQIQENKDPTTLKTVQRNQLVECYPEGETLPATIEDYVPMNRHHHESDNEQHYLIPSTSRVSPPSGPLTPFQQFINNSRESKAKEP